MGAKSPAGDADVGVKPLTIPDAQLPPAVDAAICVGTKVQVKPCLTELQYGWGEVTRASIGIVSSIDEDEGAAFVDFPEATSWYAKLSDIQPVQAGDDKYVPMALARLRARELMPDQQPQN